MKSVFGNSAGGCFILAFTLMSSALTALALPPYPAHAGQITATSQEFQVNVSTEFDQMNSAVAADSAGGSVVVWEEHGRDPSGLTNGMTVRGRLFGPSAEPLSSEFQVSPPVSISYYPCMPDVAMSPDGSFVVAWAAYGAPTDPVGITVQRYAPGGLGLGEETVVSSGGFDCFPSVSMNAAGGYAVAWENTDTSTGQVSVCCKAFNADGAQVGSTVSLPMQSVYVKTMPSVGMDASGNFTLAWVYGVEASTDRNIVAMRFNALGQPLSTVFAVSATPGIHAAPDVSANGGGEVVVAWQGRDYSGGSSMYMRRYGQDGSPSGPELTVNLTALDDTVFPSVGMDDAGNSVIAWHNYSQETGAKGIFTQLVEGAAASGCEVQLVDPEQETAYWSVSPDVAVNPSGRAIVSWDASGVDGSGLGVFARLYRIDAVDPAVPGTPMGLVATEHPDKGAELSWIPQYDTDGYVVYRDGAEIARTSTEYYYDMEARSDGTYCYTVTATSPDCFNGGESSHSSVACVLLQQAPPAPDNKPYLVFAYLTGTATLRWDEPKLGYKVYGYMVERDGKLVAMTGHLSFKDTGLGNGKYGYAVYAIGKSGKERSSIKFAIDSPRDNGTSFGKGLMKTAKK